MNDIALLVSLFKYVNGYFWISSYLLALALLDWFIQLIPTWTLVINLTDCSWKCMKMPGIFSCHSWTAFFKRLHVSRSAARKISTGNEGWSESSVDRIYAIIAFRIFQMWSYSRSTIFHWLIDRIFLINSGLAGKNKQTGGSIFRNNHTENVNFARFVYSIIRFIQRFSQRD